MRSSVLIASALAVSVLARPQLHRRQPKIVFETQLVVETVVVYVTESYAKPTSTSLALSTTAEATTTPTPEPVPRPKPESSLFSELPVTPAASPAPAPSSTPKSSSEPEYHAQPQPSPAYVAPPSSSTVPAPQPTVLSNEHSSGTDQAYLSSGADYQAAVLFHHNAARANHNAEPLTWDADCEANARIAAKKCTFEHFIPQGAGEGQNLFTVSGNAFNVTAGITESWYKGELEPMMPYFGQKDIPDEVFHRVGHLTQLVWKSTTRVGCVSLDCGGAMVVNDKSSTMNKYTVCNYSPAGNVGGEYAENVVAPISSTNLGSWTN
ncbi:PR-1-like protein [Clathrospora elynae]|uniref:PR-1-like protein n=1 Tax=Clathrospora elynae TaxID=706981 RepID=A0A6A5SG63_9PLEO|nr:PR-1-like protein [Clathrospora elynae]